MTTGRRLKVAIKDTLGLRGVKQVRLLAGPARGARMTLDFAGHTPMYVGMYEWELHGFLRDKLPGSKLIFDIGGYIGYDALLFATSSTGRVLTFEPNPAHRRLLEANLEQNPELRRRITVEPSAIGKKDGGDELTLVSAAEQFGLPDLVKMDIDGGEVDALAGGAPMLRERRPHLIVETHSKELEDECGALLLECGYRPVIKHNRQIWREQRGGAEHNRWLLAAGSPGPGHEPA